MVNYLKNCIIVTLVVLTSIPASAKNRGITNTTSSPYVKLRSVDIDDVEWTKGFWANKFKLCHNTMISNLWGLYSDPLKIPAWQNFQIAAGSVEGEFKGTKWQDGDFYKWLEAVAYVYAVTKDEKLNQQMDKIIKVIGNAQERDGYINTYMTIERKKRFQNIRDHETYNMGHLMTAGCIHYRATGKTSLLDIARKAGDCLYNTFMQSDIHFLGYSSIMGLVELSRTTGEKKYLDLAEHFVNMHGSAKRDRIDQYNDDGCGTDQRQDRIPLRQETQAVGHAVWGNYLYCGAADVYAETGDENLVRALESIWQDVVYHKMYITGGSTALQHGLSRAGDKVGEAFGKKYELPNSTAYNETCSNIASAMWNWRMLSITGKVRYADILELILYNNALSSISCDGRHFFYANPLRRSKKLHLHRKYGTTRWVQIKETCCPPNIVRTIAKTHAWTYSISDKGLWVNFYGGNVLNTELTDGSKIGLKQETDYPWDGKIKITISSPKKKNYSLMLRIPGWVKDATLKINGKPINQNLEPGTYAEITRIWKAGDVIELDLSMPVQFVEANPLVEETRNQIAIKRGPIVYCLESPDLPKDVNVLDVVIPVDIKFYTQYLPDFLGGITVLEGEALIRKSGDWTNKLYRDWQAKQLTHRKIRLIPYYAWSNRGESEMTVWMPLTFN